MNRYFIFVGLALAIAGCSQQKKGDEVPQSAAAGETTFNAVAGVQWNIPENWTTGPEKAMRVATYYVGDADGEQGECAVFFFGAGQGGDVEANIDRWMAQFENRSGEERATKDINGMPVTTVAVNGDYLSPSGPMMQSQGTKSDYRLLGAIVEAPDGTVFFKFTGPGKVVNNADGDFQKMIQSLKPTGS